MVKSPAIQVSLSIAESQETSLKVNCSNSMLQNVYVSYSSKGFDKCEVYLGILSLTKSRSRVVAILENNMSFCVLSILFLAI